ncbi:hypothetical protein J1N35_040581 [Gossypium stocksii]|uniref:Uncharacterized protein n=1 Tax=Gossypium stocksii TaxID=47602 RepID=A0A9D3UED6_9ROSI|nr:hypothetical protein J1N35_040581 [Gossypium stocksii]
MCSSIHIPHHISAHGKLNKTSVQTLLTPPLPSNVLRFEILSSLMVEKEALSKPAEANPPIEDMDLENLDSFAQNPNAGDNANGDSKSMRKREKDGEETKDVSKKKKLEKLVKEERLEEKSDESLDLGRVWLGPKEFGLSSEMLDYFYYFLHYWEQFFIDDIINNIVLM